MSIKYMAVGLAQRASATMHKKKLSNRKNSWVMLHEGSGYTPLPGETTLYQSPPRTALSLQSGARNPPAEAYSQQCKSGVIYLTNRRIIYLPVTPTPTFKSFAVPILNVSDSRVTAPWFGANKWEALIVPVYGGGIPALHSALDLTIEFKEGGAFDFATTFDRLRERLRQAVDVARDAAGDGADTGDGRGAGPLAGVDLSAVHLEDLPAYEDSRRHRRISDEMPSPPLDRGSVGTASSGANRSNSPPAEPPPGYEEVQQRSVADELERRLRQA